MPWNEPSHHSGITLLKKKKDTACKGQIRFGAAPDAGTAKRYPFAQADFAFGSTVSSLQQNASRVSLTGFVDLHQMPT